MRTTILSLAVLAATSAIAQTGLHLGVKVLPAATIFLNEDDDTDPTFGWGIGAGANFHFTPKFGVGADLLWSNATQKFLVGDSEVENKFTYLKVPLLIHFNGDPKEPVPMLGYAGIQFTMMQSVSVFLDGEESTLTDGSGNEIDSETLFEDNNMGIVIGLGPGFVLSDHAMITVMLRWDYHFNNSENPDNALWGDKRGDTHMTSIGLDIGFKINIGGGD